MRNTLKLDTTGFDKMIQKLSALGGDVRGAVEKALTESARTVSDDTLAAVEPQNLPAKGKYSHDATKASVITDTQPVWEGDSAYVPVGFDFSKVGAGGFLISGTPTMPPVVRLNLMYKGKAYMRGIQDKMSDIILDYIVRKMEE